MYVLFIYFVAFWYFVVFSFFCASLGVDTVFDPAFFPSPQSSGWTLYSGGAAWGPIQPRFHNYYYKNSLSLEKLSPLYLGRTSPSRKTATAAARETGTLVYPVNRSVCHHRLQACLCVCKRNFHSTTRALRHPQLVGCRTENQDGISCIMLPSRS